MTIATKASPTSKTTDTALAFDPDLQLSLSGGKLYEVEYFFGFAAGTTPDFKFQTVYDGTCTWGYMHARYNTIAVDNSSFRGAAVNVYGGSTAGIASLTGSGPDGVLQGLAAGGLGNVWAAGWLRTETAGTFGIKWAQNTSSGTATKVFETSWIRAVERRAPGC